MMLNGFCHISTWGSVGNVGAWVWIEWILHLVFWVGLLAGLTLLVVWAIQRARASTATVPYTTVQATAKEILQTRYARGEISREEYEQMRRDLEG